MAPMVRVLWVHVYIAHTRLHIYVYTRVFGYARTRGYVYGYACVYTSPYVPSSLASWHLRPVSAAVLPNKTSGTGLWHLKLVCSLETCPYASSSLASLAQETCPCAQVNNLSGLFFREGCLWPPSQILSLHIYNMPAVCTIGRPRLLVVHSVYRLYSGQPVCAQCR